MHSNNCFFLSNAMWCGVMQQEDVGRRVKVFDRPNGNGLIGTVTEVFSETTFRFKTDPSERYPNGREYEFSTEGNMAVRVHFLDGDF